MSHLDNAKAAWGAGVPDWIVTLATRCDAIGLKKTQTLVGYSSSTISYVLRRLYKAPYDPVELRVRATLMSENIACPELGELQLAQCLEWRDRAEDFQPTSSLRIRMLNACRICPHNAQKGG
jgi:hypothetical protein